MIVVFRKGEATEDHTTLLLNCYTKLKDSQKLDEFIMTKVGNGPYCHSKRFFYLID